MAEGFASGRALVLDARLAGVAAGAVAVLVRAPIWVAVVAGAVATALVRLALELAEAREELVRRQVGERVEHEVGLVEPELPRDAVRDADAEDPGRLRRPDPFGESSNATASSAATPSGSSASR